jgi:hypothetical protein
MGPRVCKTMFSLLKYRNSVTDPVKVHVPDVGTWSLDQRAILCVHPDKVQ